MLGYGMSYDKMVRGVCMLGCKIPTEIEHIEHDAGIEQVSHELQVRKFCNHLVELHLLFGSKRSPSVLDLIIISILKPGKPAGSARVLICNRCRHKLIIFTRCKDTKKI